ncbi:YybH family protein [Streptomyces sp. NPDC015127]|uniref:YybH family protein n=1 Tax=Streptomyces sp. NPDC015127 TaxID=3364939 RepID=UPI0036F7E219
MARTPEDAVMQFAALFNAGNLKGMLPLIYDSVLTVFEPGEPGAHGKPAWKDGMERFLRLQIPLEIEVRAVYHVGDTALVISDWSINGTAPDGEVRQVQGTSADVLRQTPDGHWKYLIDNPFGTASRQ